MSFSFGSTGAAACTTRSTVRVACVTFTRGYVPRRERASLTQLRCCIPGDTHSGRAEENADKPASRQRILGQVVTRLTSYTLQVKLAAPHCGRPVSMLPTVRVWSQPIRTYTAGCP